ncbi:MAG TPA: SPW repeat protein [Rhodocyclaceae bacterium]
MSAKMKHWQDPLNILLGLWLIASPWALGYANVPRAPADAVIIGAVIAVLAALELFQVAAWEEWAAVVLGIWMVISPWVLKFSFSAAATANAVIFGIVIAALALWALGTDREIGGWWNHPRTQ